MSNGATASVRLRHRPHDARRFLCFGFKPLAEPRDLREFDRFGYGENMANTVRTLGPLNAVPPNDASTRLIISATTPRLEPNVTLFPRRSARSPAVTELSYDEFVDVLKTALRNFNRPDLLARSPLLLSRLITAGAGANGADLQGLLIGTVNALFAGPKDERLRRVIEVSYFRPAPKQEVAAERLGLSFGTYRGHLSNALDRLAKWLWERERAQPNRPPRLSIAVMPFVNLGGDPRQDYLVDTLTEYLTTDLSRIPDIVVIGSIRMKHNSHDQEPLGDCSGTRNDIPFRHRHLVGDQPAQPRLNRRVPVQLQ
jgi:hypothetical protein